MIDFKITNVVAVAKISDYIDLSRLRNDLKIVNNKKFAGVVYKTTCPSVSIMIFKTGKIVCMGANSTDDAKKAIVKLINKLRRNKYKIYKKANIDIKIRNIVITGNLHTKINLNKIFHCLEEHEIEYDPEQFPAAIYRIKEPKTVMLIFANGKIIATGNTSVDITMKNITALEQTLKEINCL